jgi:hypothetical protein
LDEGRGILFEIVVIPVQGPAYDDRGTIDSFKYHSTPFLCGNEGMERERERERL